jgi:hypothetical protein
MINLLSNCSHKIADARNSVVKSGYMCVNCGLLFPAADHEIKKPKVITLDWSEPEPPNTLSFYDHVVAKSVLGDFIIEWKSWKMYKSYTASLNGFVIEITVPSLNEAKELVQVYLEKVLSGI